VISELKIPAPGGDVPVSVYTPVGSPAFPAIVYFHGGGWDIAGTVTALGDRAHAVVISVAGRSLEDCDAVVQWVAANPALLDLDVERIAVGGDGAGADLAASVARQARDRGGPRLVHQLLFSEDTTRSAVEDAGRELRTVFRQGWSPRLYAVR
jgi:acetyl esterase